MESSLSALIDYGSDDEGSTKGDDHSKTIVSTEEVYAQDGENGIDEPIAKKIRLEGKGIDSAVDSFLAEIGDDLEKISDDKMTMHGETKEQSDCTAEDDEENIDGEEIPPDSLPLSVPCVLKSTEESLGEEIIPSVIHGDPAMEEISKEEKIEPTPVEAEKEEPEAKIPFFKLANRCAIAMKSTLNVRSVQMEEYGGFRVYLRYDDIPICLLSSMGQNPSEVTARRSAVKELVEQMIELGLFPPNVKMILAQKITTVDKIIEVTKPVLSYLKFQLSDQRYQRMLRDDEKMSLKADCTKIQLELIGVLIEQIHFFTYRFYAEPTNNPWLHLAPVNSVAPSTYTTRISNIGEGKGVSSSSLCPDIKGMYSAMPSEVKNEPVYGGEYGTEMSASFSTVSSMQTLPPHLATGMKLTIIEDNTNNRSSDTLFPLPHSVPNIPSSSMGFQSQYVRTVAVINNPIVRTEALSAPLRINVPKHDVISEIVERTIGALGWTERNDTIMVGVNRKRAYLWVDEVPIALLGSMGESEKLSEAVSSCTHELMEQLCAWSLFPLDMVSQICRNKDHLNALLFSMSDAFSFISSTVRESQYISLHRTQGMARIPLEAPASHQAVAISFRCRVKSFMDKFWETHTIHLGPLIPLPKLEQWERVYFVHTESMPAMDASRYEEEIPLEKQSSDDPSVESDDTPHDLEEYL